MVHGVLVPVLELFAGGHDLGYGIAQGVVLLILERAHGGAYVLSER